MRTESNHRFAAITCALPGVMMAPSSTSFHTRARAISRASGRSSVAAIAYRSGEKLHDERQGITFDFTRKERVYFSEIHGTTESREAFWNRVEQHHKRSDACTAREIEVALPNSLTDQENFELASRLSKALAERYGVVADVSVHKSAEHDSKGRVIYDEKGDVKEHNPHAHITMSACSVSPDGTLGKKVNELDPIWCQRQEIETAAEVIRPAFEKIINEELERRGHEQRMEHRSFEAQGIDMERTRHVGPRGSEMAEIIRFENEAVKSRNRERTAEKERERLAVQEILKRSKELKIERTDRTSTGERTVAGDRDGASRTTPRPEIELDESGRGIRLVSRDGGKTKEGVHEPDRGHEDATEQPERTPKVDHEQEHERSHGRSKGHDRDSGPSSERERDRGDDFDLGL